MAQRASLHLAHMLRATVLIPAVISIVGSNLTDPASTTSVLVAGRELPLLAVGEGRIDAQLPYDIGLNALHQLLVRRGPVYTAPGTFVIAPSQPAIFTADKSGKGQGAIFGTDSNGTRFLAQPSSPVGPGDSIAIQCAGLGAVDPPIAAGTVPSGTPLPKTVNRVTVTIGGVESDVTSAGLTADSPGLYEILATVPRGVSGASVEVGVSVAGQVSSTVTMSVR